MSILKDTMENVGKVISKVAKATGPGAVRTSARASYAKKMRENPPKPEVEFESLAEKISKKFPKQIGPIRRRQTSNGYMKR